MSDRDFINHAYYGNIDEWKQMLREKDINCYWPATSAAECMGRFRHDWDDGTTYTGDSYTYTSLMAAVFGKRVDMVRVILESKADATLRSRPWDSSRSHLAKTAEEWAVDLGCNAVVEVFGLVEAKKEAKKVEEEESEESSEVLRTGM